MLHRIERAGFDERLQRALVECLFGHPVDQIVERRELARGFTLGNDECRCPFAHVANTRQTKAHCRLAGHRCKVHTRLVDVWRANHHPIGPGIRQIQSCSVVVALYRSEQTSEVIDRVMRLEPSGLKRDEPVSKGMTLGEGVVGELLDDAKQFTTERFAIAVGGATTDKLWSLLGHCHRIFFGTGFAQRIGFGKGVAGKFLRHSHDAFLVNHEPVGVTEHLRGILVKKARRLALIFEIRVVVVHVFSHWTRAVQRQNGGDIFKSARHE